jgi:hypothetical protein
LRAAKHNGGSKSGQIYFFSSLLAVVAATSRHGQGTAAGSHPTIVAQSLAASVTPTPRPLRTPTDPANLSPAELYCLRQLGAEAEYRQAPFKRQGLQNTISSCVYFYEHPSERSARPTPPVHLTPEPCIPPQIPSGRNTGAGQLVDTRQAEFGPAYSIQNQWVATPQQGGHTVIAYAGTRKAGAALDDYSQGVIVVQSWIFGPCHANLEGDKVDYPTPSKHGAVRIADAVGETLKLQAQDGTIFYFNVASRQWVPGFPAAATTPAAAPAGP